MLVYLRCTQKRQQNRELAESIEDARIYADSMVQMNQFNKPIDQMSMTSNQSSVLSQKPSVISSNPTGMTSPMQGGSVSMAPNGQPMQGYLQQGVPIQVSNLTYDYELQQALAPWS